MKIKTFFLLLPLLAACEPYMPVRVRSNDYASVSNEDFSGEYLPLKQFGELKNDVHIGCETLDRGYADYNAYKAYLEPLGARHIRLQAGWARCEREKGVYDFSWLDEIVDDALARGIAPWLQVSYGNPVYAGGGTAYSGSVLPHSDQALAGWDNWVRALAAHFKGRVKEWEIWNEPEIAIAAGSTMSRLIDLHIRTAGIIRDTDPDASISALALANLDASFLRQFFEGMTQEQAMLFDYVTYHSYRYRPEDSYADLSASLSALSGIAPDIKLRHGEAGAPSEGFGSGALSDWPWSEVSQAKWVLRTLAGDTSRGIRTGIYTIAESNYAAGRNTKGLLKTDSSNRVTGVKKAWYAMRNFLNVYDWLDGPRPASGVIVNCDYLSFSSALFTDDATGAVTLALWEDSAVPDDSETPSAVNLTLRGFLMENPVAVDLLSGRMDVLDTFEGNGFQVLFDVPFYDSPVLVTERKIMEKQ